MYYEINVAYNGRHYFATADRSLRSYDDAASMYRHFTKLFPSESGYELRLIECNVVSKPIVFQEV